MPVSMTLIYTYDDDVDDDGVRLCWNSGRTCDVGADRWRHWEWPLTLSSAKPAAHQRVAWESVDGDAQEKFYGGAWDTLRTGRAPKRLRGAEFLW